MRTGRNAAMQDHPPRRGGMSTQMTCASPLMESVVEVFLTTTLHALAAVILEVHTFTSVVPLMLKPPPMAKSVTLVPSKSQKAFMVLSPWPMVTWVDFV
jgi:hypothetical protein